jgi:glycosyltransferase involved in cell wall biosynthesis
VSNAGSETSQGPLRIVHVLRAPVGGLFRHVVDLVRGQSARGHRLGLITDSSTGGRQSEDILCGLAGSLPLGVTRIPMPRHLGLGDVAAVRQVSRTISSTAPDVIHGHGAKGAAYARLAARPDGAIRAYTPHGGSLHYGASPIGMLYLALERILMPRTDLLLFESNYGCDTYRSKIGTANALVRVVHNGIADHEFMPVEPLADATDLLFVGELRMLKGVDVLIDALSALAENGVQVSLTIVGDGPDRAAFEQRAKPLGQSVHFVGVLPARQAFALGRIVVVPSRAESLPYIVLEAAAAGIPVIATRVGGIPEIFGPSAPDLIPPEDPVALARGIRKAVADYPQARSRADTLREQLGAGFSLDAMIEGGLAGYRQALAARGSGPTSGG